MIWMGPWERRSGEVEIELRFNNGEIIGCVDGQQICHVVDPVPVVGNKSGVVTYVGYATDPVPNVTDVRIDWLADKPSSGAADCRCAV